MHSTRAQVCIIPKQNHIQEEKSKQKEIARNACSVNYGFIKLEASKFPNKISVRKLFLCFKVIFRTES